MTEGARARAALLVAMASLDDEGALAVYNALAAHTQNEDEHVSDLKDSPIATDRDEAPKAERNLHSIESVVEACERAIYEA